MELIGQARSSAGGCNLALSLSRMQARPPILQPCCTACVRSWRSLGWFFYGKFFNGFILNARSVQTRRDERESPGLGAHFALRSKLRMPDRNFLEYGWNTAGLATRIGWAHLKFAIRILKSNYAIYRGLEQGIHQRMVWRAAGGRGRWKPGTALPLAQTQSTPGPRHSNPCEYVTNTAQVLAAASSLRVSAPIAIPAHPPISLSAPPSPPFPAPSVPSLRPPAVRPPDQPKGRRCARLGCCARHRSTLPLTYWPLCLAVGLA
jgi:hypothetical protein